jgi:aminoglycoside 6-adenylyltransferase
VRSEQEVLELFKRWAEQRANVRAVILTSSRADPRRQPDVLSDYDVELFVRKVRPFMEDDAWMSDCGDIMVRWPAAPQSTFSDDWITQLVLYEDGTRIDFQITALAPSASDNLDHGYRILVDKDGAAAHLPEPTYSRYVIERPTVQAFDARMNAFWWDIVYVAKALRRGELNYAKYMLDGTIRFNKLQPLLEWYIGLSHDWSVSPGIYGRWFHQYLDQSTWESYQRTFAGAEVESNWRALFSTIELVRQLGHTIAHSLGFEYPADTDRKVTDYIQWIRGIDHL